MEKKSKGSKFNILLFCHIVFALNSLIESFLL